jgi:hypothetical protein
VIIEKYFQKNDFLYPESLTIAAQFAPGALTGSPESQSELKLVTGLPLGLRQTPFESFCRFSQILSPPCPFN